MNRFFRIGCGYRYKDATGTTVKCEDPASFIVGSTYLCGRHFQMGDRKSPTATESSLADLGPHAEHCAYRQWVEHQGIVGSGQQTEIPLCDCGYDKQWSGQREAQQHKESA